MKINYHKFFPVIRVHGWAVGTGGFFIMWNVGTLQRLGIVRRVGIFYPFVIKLPRKPEGKGVMGYIIYDKVMKPPVIG